MRYAVVLYTDTTSKYVMLYEKDKLPAGHRLKLLQRWVNNRIIFRSCKRFEEYDGRK